MHKRDNEINHRMMAGGWLLMNCTTSADYDELLR